MEPLEPDLERKIMSTPIEDRVTALEQWRATVDLALAAANQAVSNQGKQITALQNAVTGAGPRISALETQYADAVKRFQKAERLVARLRVILKVIWQSTSTDRATYLSRLPEDQRAQAAMDLEEINNLENIEREEDPSEWREPGA